MPMEEQKDTLLEIYKAVYFDTTNRERIGHKSQNNIEMLVPEISRACLAEPFIELIDI